jgi:uncharacterized protein (TIGR03083 family)
MTPPAEDVASLYLDAATTFADVVTEIDPSSLDGPGLGSWSLRSLVGHTSRALITVLAYLDEPADLEAIDSPEQYYALAANQFTDADAVLERGRRAGEDLGEAPAEAVQDLVEQVTARIGGADPESLITVLGGGMRLRSYLPTRTFELAVHGLDIGAATGIDVPLSMPVLAHTAALAARIGVALGEGRAILSALTGRCPLPNGFSIVR